MPTTSIIFRSTLDYSGVGEVKVTGYFDQHKCKWLAVHHEGKVGFTRFNELFYTTNQFWITLANQDVAIFDAKLRGSIKKLAQRARFDGKLLLIENSGWVGSRYFWPDSVIPSKVQGLPTVDNRAPHSRVSVGGSPTKYRDEIKRLAEGQALPTFVLCCGLAGLLLGHVDQGEDNPGFELQGKTSIGKSTLLLLAGSVFGRGDRERGTWATTVNALEATMAANQDRLLLLDETAVFLADKPREKAAQYREAIFKLSAGTTKNRFNAEAAPDRRFVWLSTTNPSVAEVLTQGHSEENVEATLVRLVTICADAGAGLGVFDRLPPGCASSEDAVQQIAKLTAEHYGWAARDFVAEFERRLASLVGLRRFQRMCKRAAVRFRARAAAAPGAETRVADKFALVAAAGSLAARWGVLPFDPGEVEQAIFTVYNRRERALAAAVVPQSALETVRAYVKQHERELVDLDSGYPNLSDAELDGAAGFLKCTGNVVWLLVRRSRWCTAFGGRSKTLLDDLEESGHLWVREGRQTQEKVRASKPKDRIYRIRIQS